MLCNRYWVGKEHGIWNYDVAAFTCFDNRSTSLNTLDISLDARDTNKIAQLRRLVHQEQNACEKVLENILERKSNRHTADAEHLDKVGGLKRRCHNGKCD